MSSSPTPARRNSIVAVAVAEVAVIAAVAVIGGGAWLLGMVVGAILGAVATLTVVARSDEVRPASEAAAPAPDGSMPSPGCRRTTGWSRICRKRSTPATIAS